MCNLFDAKPVFHGDTKTVDVLPMNPFSLDSETGLPDLTNTDQILELHYGKNLSNVTRTQNTENLVTKLYAYGSYGDKTHGYCGIDECKHTEHLMRQTKTLTAGAEYWFSVVDDTNTTVYRRFTPSHDVTINSVLIWSTMDPASMMYVWNERQGEAYRVYEGKTSNEMTFVEEVVEKQNWFSFLMDFTYYHDVKLLNDDMLQVIANYQRKAPEQFQVVNDAAYSFAEAQTELANLIGSVDFCKLSISSVESDEGYIRLVLDENYDQGVVYRSDYNKKSDDYFEWKAATTLNTKGDPVNDVASVLYVIHNTNPVSWDKMYIRNFDNTSHNKFITLWNAYEDIQINSQSDQFFLFATNNVNGKLGALEISDEANQQSLASATKVVTVPHPVYFSPVMPNADVLNGYDWWWQYSLDSKPSNLYVRINHHGDALWHFVHFTDSTPVGSYGEYWYDWSKSILYRADSISTSQSSPEWVALTEPEDKDIAKYFGTVYRYGIARDQLYQGVYQYYTHKVSSNLPAGNYYMISDYQTYWVFTTTEDLNAQDTLTYNTDKGWITQVKNGIESTVEIEGYRFDNVMHNSENSITIKDEEYNLIPVTERFGDVKGLIAYMAKFPSVADEAYMIAYDEYKKASDNLTAMDNELSNKLGDLYREGWWQSNDYVDGDEEKLYDDAAYNLKEIAKPEATYSISYVHLKSANQDMGYAATDVSDGVDWPEITASSAVHLVDEEIAVNIWAYVDKLNKCYDMPYKSTLSINTNLTTMTQHSFTDVLTNIADVASLVKGKTSIYDRASALSNGGKLGTNNLEGTIDAAKLQLLGGSSTWYTDSNGNMIFVSVDGNSAMTLTGNGFCIANSKDSSGDWNWRTFGTGDGFTADLITVGTLDANQISVENIVADNITTGTINGKVIPVLGSDKIADGAITADKIETGSITADKLAADFVIADHIAAGSITTDMIAAGSITSDKLDANAISADFIAAGSITADKLAAGVLSADLIEAGSITADKMAAGTITAESGIIAEGAVGTAQIADGSITDAKIVGLTANKITAGTLDASHIEVVNLVADNITTGTINGKVIPVLGSDKLAAGAVTVGKIADNAVTADTIVSGAVTTDKLAANAVTANKILAGAITTDKLSANAVTTDKIAAGAITTQKISSDFGQSLDLTSNNSINQIVSGLTQTYVQFKQPTGQFKAGDVWVKTQGPQQWSALNLKTWNNAKDVQWGELGYTDKPLTYVWDGSMWVLTVDYNIVEDNKTSISQTRKEIELKANQVSVDALAGQVAKQSADIKQTADAISQQVEKIEEINGQLTENTSNITTMSEAVSIQATEIKKRGTEQDPVEYVSNSTVTVKPGGVDIKSGGVIDIGAGSAIHLYNGGTVNSSRVNLTNDGVDISSDGMVYIGSGGKTIIDTGADLDVRSGGNANIKSGANVNIESGGSVNVTAGANVNVTAGGSVNVGSGSIINLTAGGMLASSKVNVTNEGVGISTDGLIHVGSGGNLILDSGSNIQIRSQANMSIESGGNMSIKAGSSFVVESGNFVIEKNGDVSVIGRLIGKEITVDSHRVWHDGNIYVNSSAPASPSEGMIWIKPDNSSIPAAGTWSHEALNSRPWSNNYVVELNGTNIGAAPANATYTYEVTIPVYYSYGKTGACTCTVYLGNTSGAKTIQMETQTFTDANEGSNTYYSKITSPTWIGNSNKIYALVVFSNGNLMTVNSYSAFTCTLMAKTSNAVGWKSCEVFMYAGQ